MDAIIFVWRLASIFWRPTRDLSTIKFNFKKLFSLKVFSKFASRIKPQTDNVYETFLLKYKEVQLNTDLDQTSARAELEFQFKKILKTRRVADRSVADRSVADRSVADKSVADRSVADRSVADRSVADRSVADKSVADRSVADRSVAERIVADRSVADRSVADRSVADRSVADSVAVGQTRESESFDNPKPVSPVSN